MSKARIAEGKILGKNKYQRGKWNSITDIKGVKVGHFSLNKDIQDESGRMVFVRTGLTAVLPYPMDKEMRLFLGCSRIKGKDEITGYEVMEDFCYLNSPIVITNSVNVGGVYDAILSYGFSLNRVEIWPPFIIGIDDSYLNDIRMGFLEEQDILKAFRTSTDSKVEQGSVGVGLGLSACSWKGGVGTSSRIISFGSIRFTIGVLVASNHGNELSLMKGRSASREYHARSGSLTIILGVDIPLVPYQIKQITSSLVALLPLIGVASSRSDSLNCVLFTTENAMSMEEDGPKVFDYQLLDDSLLEKIVLAGSEAVREAIFWSLAKATPVRGRLGRELETIPERELHNLFQDFKG